MLLKPDDPYRVKKTKDLLERLYDLGLIKNKTSLKEIDEIGISKFCRRRLSVILFRNKYCESIKQAITYIEQGQIHKRKSVNNFDLSNTDKLINVSKKLMIIIIIY